MEIIQDTREKIPWDFSKFKECTAQTIETVDAGDYIIKGNWIQFC